MTSVATTAKPALGAIWRNGLIAALISAGVNAVLYLVGSALGGFPSDLITPMGAPITLFPVILLSIVPVLLGTLGYTMLSRLPINANLWFMVVVAVVFVGMFSGPLQLPGAPMLMIVLLEVMHVVTAGATVYFLTRSR